MTDVQDRAALVCKALQRQEKLVSFLWGQNRCRFIHDDEAGFLQQAAHDLDPLADADREICNNVLRIEWQTVLTRNRLDAVRQVFHVAGVW